MYETEDIRTWTVRNVPADLIDQTRSVAFFNQTSVGDCIIEAVTNWLEGSEMPEGGDSHENVN